MTSPAAVLWDLDGTLVDTEPLWMAEEVALARAHGVEWSEADGLALVGNALSESGRYISERLGGAMTPEGVVDHLVAAMAGSLRGAIPWQPGGREVVASVAEAGVPQALVTMSYAEIAAPVAQALPFGAVVTGDAVTHGKPHPEPYLRAADLLGVEASACLAIEDSATGAASAEAAGCLVIVVPLMVDVPTSPRRIVRESLVGLHVEGLREIWSAHA
ncbi:HAD family hydrolase [Aeromicrobium sp. CF4.19]|uniref:HAD family hydrolase n=1 Tax=Aeromicrobium sp. CF4.19 TaxID=3373082 RepID=UPI003EE77E0A